MSIGGRAAYLGVGFDPVGMAGVLERLKRVGVDDPFGYVVTPNVDHLVRLDAIAGTQEGVATAAAYRAAGLALCDSRILAKLAAFDRIHLPVVPGSDLTARLVGEIVAAGDRIAIVGGDEATVAALSMIRPDVEFVQHRPPMGMRRDPGAMAAAADFVATAKARFTLLAVGSPQQELLAHLVQTSRPDARGLALCIGASIDFITGRARRAPRWMQRAHLEWLHRLASEPKRMWRRYLVEGPRILAIRRRARKG